MSAFKLIAVTNRHLCSRPLAEQIERIAASFRPDMLILREKDLGEDGYAALAADVIAVCKRHGIDCVLHGYPDAAKKLGCGMIHMPFRDFCGTWRALAGFSAVGTSVHSAEDAAFAFRHGASYVTAGHIYETDCKKGLKGRGLDFLRSVCEAVPIPVYAIGGITEDLLEEIKSTGASGACMMSYYMKY